MQVVISRLKTGQGVPHLFQKDIKNFLVLLPPLKEQKNLIICIKDMNTRVSNLLKDIEDQIQKLKEYRQSIISEAVTGKIDVRAWEPIKTELS